MRGSPKVIVVLIIQASIFLRDNFPKPHFATLIEILTYLTEFFSYKSPSKKFYSILDVGP